MRDQPDKGAAKAILVSVDGEAFFSVYIKKLHNGLPLFN